MRLSVRARVVLAQLLPVMPILALGLGATLSLRGVQRDIAETRDLGLQNLVALGEAIDQFRQEAVLLSQARASGEGWRVVAAQQRSDAVLAQVAMAADEDDVAEIALLLQDYERLAGLRGLPGDPDEADRAARSALHRMRTLHQRQRGRLQARLEDAEERAGSTMLGIVALSGLLLAGSTAGASLLSRALVRDLADLEQGTAALAAGDFGHRIPVHGDDEFGRLAEAFNRMATRISALDRMKSDFFANISHDLKTPLTSITEAADLLDEGVAGDLTEDQRRLTAVMRDSATRLRALVQNVLDLNRLGSKNVELQAGDLDAALRTVFAELRLHAESAGVHLRRAGVLPAPPALINRGMLEQVLLNLLDNALAFSPRGGTVTVSVEVVGPEALTAPAPGALRVLVQDQGPGVPPAWRERIFERYAQAPGGPRRGTGLGLAICKSIVETHGGRIGVADSPEGGAALWFTLALAMGPTQPAPPGVA